MTQPRPVATVEFRVPLFRLVHPEILDALPQDSPEALASRRDLRIINRLLGTQGWFKRALQKRRRSGESVLEIGAGTGELARALAASMPGLAGLDLVRQPIAWPQSSPWFETNLFEFGNWSDYPIVIGNLFFHHFDAAGLARIGSHLNRHARVIIASDPLRLPHVDSWYSVMCRLIRADPVTRYDGRASIVAGFRGDELPRLLQLNPKLWQWRAEESWRGTNRLIAEKRS